jgi:quinol monooxygenase YgiN
MIIVAGTLDLEPSQRADFLAGQHDTQLATRTEPGCLEYAFSADSVDPGRVRLFEVWASQEHLDQHLAAARSNAAARDTDNTATPRAVEILAYPIIDTGPRPL